MHTVLFPHPDQPTLFDFIIQSNGIAHLDLEYQDVLETFQKKALHPAASGHFAAIFETIKLAKNHSFPAKHPIEYETPANADKNLYWLRNLHTQVLKPVAIYGEFLPELSDYPNPKDCGTYRLTNYTFIDGRTGYDRPTPKPNLIKPLLHWWYKDLCTQHALWAPKLDKVGQIKLDDVEILENLAKKKHLQLLAIRPFLDANGRVARLVENALRLRWGIRWTTQLKTKTIDYVDQVMKYEDSQEWKQVLNTVK
jgi:hypothetical protein